MITEISQAVVLTIGDELLIGHTVNTNASWLCSQLDSEGFEVVVTLVVRDREEDILNGLSLAASKGDIIICTGGMGPTADDITKPAICKYFNTGLEVHEESLAQIRAFFRSRGLGLSKKNQDQALVPSAADVILNKAGTAPGLSFKQGLKRYFFLPGVPFEMQYLFEHGVADLLRAEFQRGNAMHRTLLVHGIGESFLSDKLKDFEDSLPSFVKLAYLPSPGIVKLRLTARNTNPDELKPVLDALIRRLYDILGSLIYGEEDDSLELIIGRLLIEKGLSLSIAESCTGGSVSQLITGIPGASRYFRGCIVAYANEIKINVLRVNPQSIFDHGAVSESVAKQMAENVRKVMDSAYGLASTGIAGPDGGTPEKPVGTVYLAVSGPHGTTVKKFHFGEHRSRNILRSSLALLDMLRLELQKT